MARAGGPALVAFTVGFGALAQELLGGLCAGYLVGSVAGGDASAAASDLDVMFATAPAPGDPDLRAAGERLADAAADCPLRGVEAVLYDRDVLAAPRHPLAYLLNVNAGRSMPRRVATGGDPAFWFLLDVAIAAEAALPLWPAPPGCSIGKPPDADVRMALAEALRWHLAAQPAAPDAVLNACRAWYWNERGSWVSKSAAGRWAAAAGGGGVVEAALRARAAGVDDATLDRPAASALQERVLHLVTRA